MIEFVLNKTLIRSKLPPGMPLLDFIRDEAHLKGTKTACREGDCGACTVMIGELKSGIVQYRSIVSCLTPLGLAHGKHIVTIEGLNMDRLNPAQQSLVSKGGTQCGFCTPGIVVSLTESLINNSDLERVHQTAGNICRCTGYKSIEKAIAMLDHQMDKLSYDASVEEAVKNGFLPVYFLEIADKLKEIVPNKEGNGAKLQIGGGTDLFVQRPHELLHSKMDFTTENNALNGIEFNSGKIRIGSAVTTAEIMAHPEIKKHIPEISDQFLLISSPQIRNTATLGGNIVNASPIGDLSIFFLALNSDIGILNTKNKESRVIPLSKFFLGYKELDMKTDEIVEFVEFDIPGLPFYFNFEKVSKRKHLDIASVNSAIKMIVDEGEIKEITITAGGVAPFPLILEKTAGFLKGKKLDSTVLPEAVEILQTEISPIDDIRGSSTYKRLLLRQLIYAHFLKYMPDILNPSHIKNPVAL